MKNYEEEQDKNIRRNMNLVKKTRLKINKFLFEFKIILFKFVDHLSDYTLFFVSYSEPTFILYFFSVILLNIYYFIKNIIKFILLLFLIFSSFFFFFKPNVKKEEKLTEWEIEFQKEKEKEKELDEIEKQEEKKAFKKNRSERRKRRKIRYETVEYPGEKYHPDYDGIYFFYERFQDAIWRTDNMRFFRSKFKIYFPIVMLFVFVFLVWLVGYLSNIDFFVYDANIAYIKIDNQFVSLNRKVFDKKYYKIFITVFDWNTQLVTRYKVSKFGKFKECEQIFITELKYNWMFQKDIRSKKFPFKFYNWIFYKNDIMICGEKPVKIIPKKKKKIIKITKWMVRDITNFSPFNPFSWFNMPRKLNKLAHIHNYNIVNGRPRIDQVVIIQGKNDKRDYMFKGS